LEYLDYTVKTPEELDAVYGLATLGVIGLIEGEGKEGVSQKQVVTLSDSHSPAAEAFRALRTNIQFASPGKPVRSLLITSAGPTEGKTLTAANLAVSLAQGGNRVILVDTDLRKPRVHRLFEVPKAPGFTNLVINQKSPLSPDPPLPTLRPFDEAQGRQGSGQVSGEGGTGRVSSASPPDPSTELRAGLGGLKGSSPTTCSAPG
jgi:Mrp family chromosome partitioning ATPase